MFRRLIASIAHSTIAGLGLLFAGGSALAVDDRSTNGGTESRANSAAIIDVRGPRDAEIWFDGMKTVQTGMFRRFVSPPLAHGPEYVYEIQAKWQQDGQERTLIRRVTFRAGDVLNLSFETVPVGRPAKARNPGGYNYDAYSPRSSPGSYYSAPYREASPNRKVAPANEQDPMRGFGPPGFPEYQ